MLTIDFDAADARHIGLTPVQLAERGVSAPAILAAMKIALKADVDAEAERLRLALITPGTGQALEYSEAQDQAAAALKAPSSASAEKYPMLAASIGLDLDPQTGQPAADVLGVARSVQAARDLWLTVGSQIRRARLSAKASIEAAGTPEAAEAARSAVIWPTVSP